MRLVVTGKVGQIARALLEAGARQGVDVVPVGRPELDLLTPQDGLTRLAQAMPDAIVSAAAYTAVDKAEREAEVAEAINAAGPAALAGLAAELNIPIIHLSTDYVFDGRKPTAYLETDPTNPLGVYGATKLQGELAVASTTANHAILRTAWVYSPFGNNFLKTMLRLAGTTPKLRVVDDQRGNPTSALDVADAIVSIANNLVSRPADLSLRGIFHLVGAGTVSWAGFATEIFAGSASLGGPRADVVPISTADYPTAARRPANSHLDTTKLQEVHGVVLPPWQRSTLDVVRRLLSDGLPPGDQRA